MSSYRFHQLKGVAGSREVYLNGKKLSPARSQQIRNHSPDGFSWGYGGSGPAQLALAVMLELAANEQEALSRYQDFKFEVIAKLPVDRGFEVYIIETPPEADKSP